FQELHQHFAEKIIDPATIGFAKTVDAGMLDETLAATELKAGSDVERFQTVKAVSKSLSDHYASTIEKNDDAGFAGFAGGAILFFLVFLFSGAAINDRYSREPRRIPSNRPKTPYGKH